MVAEADQETNDLDKSLRKLKAELTRLPNNDPAQSVLILGAFGGRFDQEMANIHALYAWKDSFHRMVLVDETCTAELLDAGTLHKIIPMSSSAHAAFSEDMRERVEEGRYCGLLPLAQPIRSITTTGLAWNLNAEPLAIGQRISTSNTLSNRREVTVQSSEPVLWTSSYDISS